MRPLSMDDYTDTEFTGQKKKPLVERMGLIPYGGRENAPFMRNLKAAINKLGATALGDNDAVMGAYNISREVAEGLKFKDNDKTEDTLRHILLGGLVESSQGQAFIAGREGEDKESRIDHNNNLFGKALRKKYPDRQSFVNAAIATAIAVGEGNMKNVEELNGLLPMLSMGTPGDFQRAMPPMPEDTAPAPAPIPENIKEPDPRKSTDDYTVTQKKGGIMKAQQGVMPMTKATSNPTGNKPPETVNVPRGVGRPKNEPESNDIRDIAIAKLKNSLGLKKGAVKIDKELKEGTKPKESTGMAVMIGLGAPEIDYSKGEEGDPPPGATKKEVADDQMVLMSEGELVVPANVVRYHGLATYEGMRREALSGLQEMEFDGQISYIDEGKTKKTREGGIMKAQQGITPLPVAEAASSQFLMKPTDMEVYSPARPFPIRPLEPQPVYPQVSQYTPVYPTYAGLAGSPKVVAPNIGYYLPEEQRSSFMRPDAYPTSVVPTATSIGAPPVVNNIPYDDMLSSTPPAATTTQPTTTTTTATTTQAEPPQVVSEEQEDYIRSGQADQEIAKANRIAQNLQQGRADEARGTYPEFTGFSDFPDSIDMNQLSKENLKKEFDTLRDTTAEGFKDLFRGPEDLKTTSPFEDAGKYKNLPLSNLPSAFLESITNPRRAAIRNENYNPSKADIAAALNPSIRFDSKALQAKANELTPDQLEQYGYDEKNTVKVVTGYDPDTGEQIVEELGTYVGTTQEALAEANRTYTDMGTYTSAEKSKRRGEANQRRAQETGLAAEGIKSVTAAEQVAYININKSLNQGQFDPNGVMGVKQFADFKKTGLQMNDFFKLSRAEQSFYAAARTGDTVEPWVIDSMREGTTQAFDDMNRLNNAHILKSDEYEIQSDKQFKPADAREGVEVNVMSYWQSKEGQAKGQELGVLAKPTGGVGAGMASKLKSAKLAEDYNTVSASDAFKQFSANLKK